MPPRRIHVHIGRIAFRGGAALDAERITAAIRAEILGIKHPRDITNHNADSSRPIAERIGAAVAAVVKTRTSR